MGQELQELLKSIHQLEERGNIEEATAFLDQLIRALPDNGDILLEKAQFEFRQHMDREALLDFCEVYSVNKDSQIKDFLLEAYYQPNAELLEKTLNKNRDLLREYPYLYEDGEQTDSKVFPLWYDDEYCIWYDAGKDQFRRIEAVTFHFEGKPDTVILVEQCMWIADILHFEKVTRQSGKYLDMELPFYLMWEKDGFAVFLRLVDLQTMIEEKRIVYLIGAASVNNYFKNEMTPLPTLVFPYMSEKCRDLIQSLTDERKHLFCQSQEEINLYYEKNAEQIIQNIQNGLPRILFLTSRFTTAVQYYFRDMADAACRAGCKCVVVKEENALQRVNPVSLIAQINRLKPDVVVCVDHFRFEEIDVPKQLVWITWIQDPLPDIMNPETPSKLLATDVVINQFYSWKKLTDIYRDIDMMDASVPTNPLIYKPYKLSPQEWEAYGADIAIVCHFTPSEKAMLDLLKDIPEELSNTLRSLHMDYYQMLYETGKPLCGEKAFAEYVFKEWQKYEGVVSDKDDLMPLVNHMATTYGQWTFRENLAHWILDAGFENLKLWGNGWNQIERFRPYAMGPAPNGEILSKIYQASKIVLGSNSVCTAATRAGEAMMSGGFYLANYLPPEADWVDLRMQLEEDRDFVMYNGRDDLIEKLHYYLEHEEERKCMAEAERKAALKHMTFDSFIQRFLKEVPHILEKQLQKEEISELPK